MHISQIKDAVWLSGTECGLMSQQMEPLLCDLEKIVTSLSAQYLHLEIHVEARRCIIIIHPFV